MPREEPIGLSCLVREKEGGVVIVFSMARVGSHSIRDRLRLTGHPGAFVLHAMCRDNGHLTPPIGRHEYLPTDDPENVGGENLVYAQRLRSGEGLKCIVPVRHPFERAVSAWRYFHKSRGRIEDYDHEAADQWWRRQAEAAQGEEMPRWDLSRGWWEWKARHEFLVVKIELAAGCLGPLGRAVATQGEPVRLEEAFKDRLRGGFVAQRFYPGC